MAAVCVSSDLLFTLFSPRVYFSSPLLTRAIFHHVCNLNIVWRMEKSFSCFQSRRDAKAAKNYNFRFIYSPALSCSGALILQFSFTRQRSGNLHMDRTEWKIFWSPPLASVGERIETINKFSIAHGVDRYFLFLTWFLCEHKLWISKAEGKVAWKVEHFKDDYFAGKMSVRMGRFRKSCGEQKVWILNFKILWIKCFFELLYKNAIFVSFMWNFSLGFIRNELKKFRNQKFQKVWILKL